MGLGALGVRERELRGWRFGGGFRGRFSNCQAKSFGGMRDPPSHEATARQVTLRNVAVARLGFWMLFEPGGNEGGVIAEG